MKKTIRALDVTGKRVLLRADLNVPIQGGQASDDARILAVLPTIRYLIEQRARVILVSHLGRPNGFVVESLRMNPVAERLADLLQQPVIKINNVIGPEVEEAAKYLKPGDVLMLENVRFHPGELVNDAHFAARLASVADVFVSDAFASAHRSHASNTGVARYLPAVAGLLMDSELQGLRRIEEIVQPPVVVVLGGQRLVDKLSFIEYCLGARPAAPNSPSSFDVIREAQVLFGGVLANTLLRAQGYEVGQSGVEMRSLRLARQLLALGNNTETARNRAGRLHLPTDVVVVDTLSSRANRRVTAVDRVPPTGYIVDLGPQTLERYRETLDGAGTVIWSGPLGLTEIAEFSQGTNRLIEKLVHLEDVITIVGGGDTTAALSRSGLASKIDYLSTGGAAFLHALQGQSLPGVAVLEDYEEERVRE